MKFSDFVSSSAICAELSSLDKDSVIAELVESLVAAGEIKAEDREDIIKAIMKREELGSTGIGRGIAVPHTKHASVDKLVGTVGVSGEEWSLIVWMVKRSNCFSFLFRLPIVQATTCELSRTFRVNCGMTPSADS